MNSCIYCGQELPDEAKYCHVCGKKQTKRPRATRRANGEGSVRRSRDGRTWRVELVLWYYWDESKNRLRPRTVSKAGFKTKADAVAYIPELRERGFRKWGRRPNSGPKRPETLREVYDAWLPTHQAGKSTMDCYRAAWKHLAPLHDVIMDEIYVDDLQECLDDCSAGKRTVENVKALIGLLYKYAVPRKYVSESLILSQYLVIHADKTEIRRTGLTKEELERLRKVVGKVPFADYVYCMCYLGFRPSEFLDLTVESYNRVGKYFTGGAKTEAGKNRLVPVSPKIQPIIDRLIKGKTSGFVFCDENGNRFDLRKFREEYFGAVLDAIGISEEERKARLLTPHCCRHTFANLLRDTKGADKNKLALIGHTSPEMLRHYQDSDLDGLRSIVNSF